MKIINSIMPMGDVEALAANGQKLRVAVTKTSAQGKSAQSSTPNLMSFSTDENSVWFNGKKYGVTVFKDIFSLGEGSDVQEALGGLSYTELENAVSNGGVFVNISRDQLGAPSVHPINITIKSEDNNQGNLIVLYDLYDEHTTSLFSSSIVIKHYNGTYSVYEEADLKDILTNYSIDTSTLSSTDNTVPSSNLVLKSLNTKLDKSSVVNSLTSTDTSKALSAAQGKALNDRISGLGSVYRVKGTKTNLSDVLALTDAKVGDVWNVTNAFTLGGKPYPANTNVVCITATSSSDHDEGNWDPLGGTVNLSTYVSESDIVDNLSTSDSKKPLSAKQGLALATMITELEDNKETYQFLKTLESGTLSTQSEIDAILGSYSSFNAALNAGKVIHGVYKDSINRMNTVAFSVFNDTVNSRVKMFAILNNSTLLYTQATYSGTNWTSATTSEETLSIGITIE